MIRYKESFSRILFRIVNALLVIIISIACFYPFWNTIMISFSRGSAVGSGLVTFYPIGFQLDAYENILSNTKFFTAFWITIKRTVLGLIIGMSMTVLAGYPLSMPKERFPHRDFFMWMYVFTMLFGGGMIPTYRVVKGTGLLNTIWALVLPGAVSAYNIILLQNYFKGLPKEIYDSARVDGAGEWRILLQMYLPLAKPGLATLAVFNMVGSWNAYFDGMLYMHRAEKYPMQTYLRTVMTEIDMDKVTDIRQIQNLTEENAKAAQIVVALIPILCVYPFLQKYFTSGIVMGSVKG